MKTLNNTIREEFEKWCKENPAMRSYMWKAWQAACKSKQKEIDDLHATMQEQSLWMQNVRKLLNEGKHVTIKL